MEFSEHYLNYEEYKSLGGTLDIMPFNILEFECRKIIDTKTQNRLKGIDVIPQEVKMCMYAMMNSIEQAVIKNKSNVASENIDGYSVTYLSPTEVSQVMTNKQAELEDYMFSYLMHVVVNGTSILYLGVK